MRAGRTWQGWLFAGVAMAWLDVSAAVLRDQADVRGVTDGRLLYRESHYLERDGASERWVLYRCPDGKPFARKHVSATQAPMAPNFALEDGRDGYREGVRDGKDARIVYAGVREAVSTKTLVVPADGVIDAGFDAAVRAHWHALLAGKAVELRFLVPSREQFYPVRVQRIAGGAGEPRTMQLRMRLATWFGFAIPDVLLVYGLDDRRLRAFSGTGNIRDARGRNPQVRIAFAPQAATASREEFARIKTLPLDGRCQI